MYKDKLVGPALIIALSLIGMLVLYGAMELAYRMGEQMACHAKTSFILRENAPALHGLERKAHYVISTTPVGGA